MFLFYPYNALGAVGLVNLDFTNETIISLFLHYVYFGKMGMGVGRRVQISNPRYQPSHWRKIPSVSEFA